eukprot:14110_1
MHFSTPCYVICNERNDEYVYLPIDILDIIFYVWLSCWFGCYCLIVSPVISIFLLFAFSFVRYCIKDSWMDSLYVGLFETGLFCGRWPSLSHPFIVFSPVSLFPVLFQCGLCRS